VFGMDRAGLLMRTRMGDSLYGVTQLHPIRRSKQKGK